VHDAPVVLFSVSSDEANLATILKLLNEERLGWAVRRDDEALRADVDAALDRFRTDGTRDAILTRWLPYWQRLEASPAK
jgi:ABC-type amino acid transport substrate-binding protein